MCRVLPAFFIACALLAQQTPFDRLKQESARVKALHKQKPDASADVKALHLALRNWIESELPQRPGSTPGQFTHIEAMLQDKLKKAGLIAPDEPDGPGYVQLELKWLPEFPDALFVIAGAQMECGADNAIYMYQFNPSGRARVFEEHPGTSFGYAAGPLQLTVPDAQGRRLLLTHYTSVQCQSTWMVTAYSVHRLDARGASQELLVSANHTFWLGNDGPDYVLKPDELILQFLDSSVDAGIHNRTQILRYNFAQGVQRLDPVALQPQDFAEEWLTRPWTEMQSRSAPATKDWHARLHADYVNGDYTAVVPCAARPGRWLIALDILRIGEKKLPEPLSPYFLVHDLGNYHYKMEAVSDAMPSGCPGAGIVIDGVPGSNKHPTLTVAQLNALR